MSRRRKLRASSSDSALTPGALAAPLEADSPRLSARTRAHDAVAGILLAVASLVLGRVVFQLHRVPFYGVETDLLGEYIPAARDLLAGRLPLDALIARGPVYPASLAMSSWLTGGDFYLAARIVSFGSALVAAAFTYLFVADFLGGLAGLGSLLLLLGTPVFIECTVHTGGDMPAFALMIGAAWLACFRRGTRAGVAGGLLTALAILSRPNALALIPAGAVALWPGPGRPRRVLEWGAAVTLPLAAWWMFLLAHGVHPGASARDTLNIAFEFYGGDAGWEQFWRGTGQPFHTVFDVVRYAPGTFLAHYARNLATRFWEDGHHLLPSWTAWLAVPGMIVSWGRSRRWPGVLAHFLCAYALLALVFYTPRFFLFLLPFYCSGVSGELLVAADWLTRRARPRMRRVAIATAMLAVAAFAIDGGRASALQISHSLDDAPVEALDAARVLRAIARPGDRIVARKPHVAYFAGLKQLPMPSFGPYEDLFTEARAESAGYLFISPIEVMLQPRLAPLSDGMASLPGLALIAQGEPRPGHFYVLYRFTDRAVGGAAFTDSVLETLRQFALRHPGQGQALSIYGLELVGAHRDREAVPVLTLAARWAGNDPEPLRSLAVAYAELSEYDQAIVAATDESRRDADSSWANGFIGQVCLEEHRYDEARARFAVALRLAPTNARVIAEYARACFGSGAWADAAQAGERALQLRPEDPEVLDLTVRAWRALGREDRARELLASHSR